MKQNDSKRLPGYDQNTSKAEALAFLSLGVAGLLLITAAGVGSVNYAEQRESIVQSLTEPATALVQGTAPVKALTNIAAKPVTRQATSS